MDSSTKTAPVAFAPGDIFLAATDLDDSHIDFRNLKGDGRILHFGPDFTPKATLWTGHVGLVVNLAFEPFSGTLYSTDPTGRHVIPFDRSGLVLPEPDYLPNRAFGALIFAPDGTGYIGVQNQRGAAPDDLYGAAKLFAFSPNEKTVKAFDVEVDGGHTGWHCVNYLALAADGKTLFYCSEGGRRVMRYDLEAERQLPDFLVFAEDDADQTFGINFLPDGDLLMVTGNSLLRLDTAGKVKARHALSSTKGPSVKGWTRVVLAQDGETAFVVNFLEGRLERRRIADGAVVFEHDIGKKCSLCGVAEFTASRSLPA